ncbi:MAG TPA: trypsin-like peptidase domain-containing protein [Myxococcales bacterium]|nr:trypsin-like peptidase domain-containing protein [Myxococcales bacterium]
MIAAFAKAAAGPAALRACALAAFAIGAARAAAAAPAAATAASPARRTALVQAVERAKSAVVNISAQEVVRAAAATDPFELFFGHHPRDQVRTSLGSGFVFDPAGYLLTNFHVIERGSKIAVSFDDGSEYTAKVVGTDPGGDLAVLKISGKKFPALPLGVSADLMLGEPTIAIGNPFGLNQSVSAGVVSALHRTVRAEERSYYDFIQTDASINPGNSGGPLLNAEGEVIGVCSAIYAKAQGIGFAIPIDRALRVARELVKSGEIGATFWGFDAETIDARAGQSRGLKAGAVVSQVEADSPAASAGLRRDDVVVRMGDAPVHDADELRFLLRDVPAGTKVALALLRGKQKLEVSIAALALTPERAQQMFENRSGLALAELSPAQAREAGYETQRPIIAVKLVERNSGGARAGIRRGDLVRAVNSAEIETLKDLRKALTQARKSGRTVLLVQRGYRLQEFTFDAG